MQQYLIRYYRFIGQKYIVIYTIIIGRTSEDSTDFFYTIENIFTMIKMHESYI